MVSGEALSVLLLVPFNETLYKEFSFSLTISLDAANAETNIKSSYNFFVSCIQNVA